MLLGWSSEGRGEIGGACSTYGRDAILIQNFGRKAWREET